MRKFVFSSMMAILGLASLGLGFVFFSSQGIRTCIHAVDRALPGRLSVASVRGRFADRFQLEGIQYIDETVVVAVDSLSLSWNPASLLNRSIVIRSLDLHGVDLVLAESATAGADSAGDDIFPPRFSLPLSLRVDHAAVQSLNLTLPGESRPVQISALSLENASFEAGLIRFEQGAVTAPSYRIGAGGRIETGETSAARFSMSYVLHPEGFQPIEGTGEISGSPAELNLNMQLRRPFAGVLQGTVYDLLTEARWKGELRTDQAELSGISREWPNFIFSRFQAHGSGTLAAYSLQVRADADYENIRDIHVQTTINGDVDGLRLSDTQLSRNDGFLTGEGRLDWRGDFSWQAQLSGTAVNLAEVSHDWPDMVLSDIVASGSGLLETYLLQVEAEAEYKGVEDAHLVAAMEGDADGLQFTDATVSREDATVTGQGILSWKEDFSWQATAAGKDVNPSVLLPQWPGRLDFRGSSSGTLTKGLVRTEIHLDSLEGEVRNHPLRANGTIGVEGDNYVVDGFYLETTGSSLEASGRFADTVDLRFAMHSSDLAALWPDASGSLQARGGVVGDRRQPVFELELTGDRLSLNEVFIGNLAADAAGDLSPEGGIRASVEAKELRIAGGQLETIHLELHGLTEKHYLQAKVRGHGIDGLLAFDGGLKEKSWEGFINRADITSARFGNWRLPEPAAIRLAEGEISLARLCLSGTESALICLAGEQGHTGPWQARADIQSLPLSLLPAAQGESHDIQGLLAGTVVVEGDGAALLGGRLDLSTSDASLLLALPGEGGHRLTWRDNSFQAVYDDGRVTATLESVLQDGSFLLSSVTLTDFHPSPFSLEGAYVDGSLEISVKDLQPLAALTYPNLEPSGSLRGNVSFLGPAAEPELQGSAELIQGKMIIPPLGITLEGLKMTMEATNQAVELHFSGNSGGGEMNAETRFSWPRDADEPIIVNISGDRFEIIHSPELRLWASPDLNMKITRRQAELKGTIEVPEALITPRNLSGTVSPSRDVVLVDARSEKKQEQGNLSLYADVMVVAGENVQVNAFGLKGKVEGKLRVVNLPSKPVIGEGNLQVKEGTFAVYGRRLQIETGRLLFSGGPIDNPGIEVRAENVSSGVTTGIQVSGVLSEPEISFYSTPPMEEDQIISRLLMNTSLIGSSGDDGGFLGGVTADTGLDKLSATVQEVRESLNVDDIRIETGRASEDLSLVIGTWLTPSLYISYGKNLLKESGSFNTRYQLWRGFFMETETGSTQSGADLKYEIER